MKWSYSQSNTFFHCRRKYYLSNILASDSFKEPLRRKTFELKHTINLDMFAGTIVDKTMELMVIPAIKEKTALDFELFVEWAIRLAKEQMDFSAKKLYRNQTIAASGNSYCVLDIDELNISYTDEDIENVFNKIRQSILNIPQILMKDGTTLLEFLSKAEERLYPNVGNRGVHIGETWVNPQIDLIATIDFNPCVIDWKVSESETSDYFRQLSIIGTVIYRKKKENHLLNPIEHRTTHQFGDITLLEVNLLTKRVQVHKFNEDVANSTIDHINMNSRDLSLLHTKGLKPSLEYMLRFDRTEGDACDNCSLYHLCCHLHKNKHQFNEKEYTESLSIN